MVHASLNSRKPDLVFERFAPTKVLKPMVPSTPLFWHIAKSHTVKDPHHDRLAIHNERINGHEIRSHLRTEGIQQWA